MSAIDPSAGMGWASLLAAYGSVQRPRRDGRLFDDPLSSAFIGSVAAGVSGTSEQPSQSGPSEDEGSSILWETFRFYFSTRRPFYDRWLEHGIARGHRQVVLLAAGLDGRAFRLSLPADVSVFELDHAQVLEFKNDVIAEHGLSPGCRRVPVATDLRGNWAAALIAAGFDPALPTTWVAEGLLMYMHGADCDRLMETVTAVSGPGSRIVAEYFDRVPVEEDMPVATLGAADRRAWDLLRALLASGPVAEDPGDWLTLHGWTPHVISDIVREGVMQGRAVPLPLVRRGAPTIWLFQGTLGDRSPGAVRQTGADILPFPARTRPEIGRFAG